jgi:hypothetical protein
MSAFRKAMKHYIEAKVFQNKLPASQTRGVSAGTQGFQGMYPAGADLQGQKHRKRLPYRSQRTAQPWVWTRGHWTWAPAVRRQQMVTSVV